MINASSFQSELLRVMAAIICRICIVKPYEACRKCCIKALNTQYWEQYYEIIGKYIERLVFEYGDFIISNASKSRKIIKSDDININENEDKILPKPKPLSGCLFMSIIINCFVLFGCIISILIDAISGFNGCDGYNLSLLPLVILLFICALINASFTYYMYYTINYSTNNPLFNQIMIAQNINSKSKHNEKLFYMKLYEFFKYDIWMAMYIIYLLFKVIILSLSISLSINCNSAISILVLCTSIILFLYLIVSILTLFSYISFELFKEMARHNWCWYLPFFWPCLFIGYGLNIIDQHLLLIHAQDINQNNHNLKDDKYSYIHKYKLFCLQMMNKSL